MLMIEQARPVGATLDLAYEACTHACAPCNAVKRKTVHLMPWAHGVGKQACCSPVPIQPLSPLAASHSASCCALHPQASAPAPQHVHTLRHTMHRHDLWWQRLRKDLCRPAHPSALRSHAHSTHFSAAATRDSASAILPLLISACLAVRTSSATLSTHQHSGFRAADTCPACVWTLCVCVNACSCTQPKSYGTAAQDDGWATALLAVHLYHGSYQQQ